MPMPQMYPSMASGSPAEAPPGRSPPSGKGETPPGKDDEAMGTLVPRSHFKGVDVQPGTTGTFRVVRVYEGECEVVLEPNKAESDEKPGTPSEMPADDELDLLSKE